MISKICISLLCCGLVFFGSVAKSQTVKNAILVTTGELPPYSYMLKGQQVGIATDIVKEISSRMGATGIIKVTPWARTIKNSTNAQTLTYPVARLPYREKQYQWIGPILTDTFAFAVRKRNTKNYSNIEDLKLLRVGVNRGAPTEKRLKTKGFKNLYSVGSEEQNAKMLIVDRIDAWYTTKLMISHLNKELFEEEEFRIAYSDIQIDMYITASKDVAKKDVEAWQDQLDAMKSDGTYSAIIEKYTNWKYE